MAITDATALGSPRISLSLPCSSGVCLVHNPKSYPSGILSRVLSASAVETPPGWMLTARSPCLAYSSASECVNDKTPPLLAA